MSSSRRVLLSLLLFVLWIKGGTDGSDVSQTSMLWTKKGQDATMNCSHTKGVQYFQMYWYRQLPGETMEQIVFTSTGNKGEHDFGAFSKEKFSATKTEPERGTFTVKKVQPEDKGLYFCGVSQGDYEPAYFGRGTKLTVLEPGAKVTAPTRVKVLSPSEKECSSGKKTLVCVASGFYPDHVSVSWMINGGAVSKGVATDSAATRQNDTSYRITSRLTVFSEEWTSNNLFVCSVSFFDGTTTTYHNGSITGEAKKIPSGTELSRDKYLRITQSAKLSYIIFIVKSCIYGAFIWFVAWKLQSSREKRRK